MSENHVDWMNPTERESAIAAKWAELSDENRRLATELTTCRQENKEIQKRYEKQCEGTHSRMERLVSLKAELIELQAKILSFQKDANFWSEEYNKEKDVTEKLQAKYAELVDLSQALLRADEKPPTQANLIEAIQCMQDLREFIDTAPQSVTNPLAVVEARIDEINWDEALNKFETGEQDE